MAFVEHVCICGFMNLQDRFQDISQRYLVLAA